jgi:hypothetical protein
VTERSGKKILLSVVRGILERAHDELHQGEAMVSPVEVVSSAGVSGVKVPARISKNKQAAIGPEVNLHVAQVVQADI